MTSGASARSGPPLRFAFVSSNFTWGGSEELWSAAAVLIARQGHPVTVYKKRLKRGDGHSDRLHEAGCALVELARFPFLPTAAYSAAAHYLYPLNIAYQALRLHVCLRLRRRPTLLVLSQGGNHDGWLLAKMIRRLRLPYVLICQKATELYWPEDRWLGDVRGMYRDALHAFFVAEHNRRLTEEQIGTALPASSVVRNPFKVSWARPQPWPRDDGVTRIACVGRLYPKEKGQDLLLRVVATEKWRARRIELSFFGSGEQRAGLERMAAHLGLENVRFAGQVDDVAAIWADHHALILPSRAEGLPLVIVEAMLSGRVVIATDVAGNGEAVRDGDTGFLAAAPTEAALDKAMERAWTRRHEWDQIGDRAATATRALVPEDPAAVIAERLLRIAAEASGRHSSTAPPVPTSENASRT